MRRGGESEKRGEEKRGRRREKRKGKRREEREEKKRTMLIFVKDVSGDASSTPISIGSC